MPKDHVYLSPITCLLAISHLQFPARIFHLLLPRVTFSLHSVKPCILVYHYSSSIFSSLFPSPFLLIPPSVFVYHLPISMTSARPHLPFHILLSLPPTPPQALHSVSSARDSVIKRSACPLCPPSRPLSVSLSVGAIWAQLGARLPASRCPARGERKSFTGPRILSHRHRNNHTHTHTHIIAHPHTFW